MLISVNIWAVVLAMVGSMVVGSIWYAQGVFGRVWARLAKVDMTRNRGPIWQPLAVTAVVSTITAWVLASITMLAYQYFQATFLQDALMVGFWLWLGFTAARLVTHDVFEGRPVKLTLLNAAHELVTITVMAAVIGLFGAPMD
ncbi:MAG TPA: DUF1761 domain-containing protein [Candidatus Saccharimonadia bacterium]